MINEQDIIYLKKNSNCSVLSSEILETSDDILQNNNFLNEELNINDVKQNLFEDIKFVNELIKNYYGLAVLSQASVILVKKYCSFQNSLAFLAPIYPIVKINEIIVQKDNQEQDIYSQNSEFQKSIVLDTKVGIIKFVNPVLTDYINNLNQNSYNSETQENFIFKIKANFGFSEITNKQILILIAKEIREKIKSGKIVSNKNFDISEICKKFLGKHFRFQRP